MPEAKNESRPPELYLPSSDIVVQAYIKSWDEVAEGR